MSALVRWSKAYWSTECSSQKHSNLFYRNVGKFHPELQTCRRSLGQHMVQRSVRTSAILFLADVCRYCSMHAAGTPLIPSSDNVLNSWWYAVNSAAPFFQAVFLVHSNFELLCIGYAVYAQSIYFNVVASFFCARLFGCAWKLVRSREGWVCGVTTLAIRTFIRVILSKSNRMRSVKGNSQQVMDA